MRWHKTNFNMPVFNLWEWSWSEWWVLSYLWQSTSYDLSGFRPWFETFVWMSFCRFNWPLYWTIYINQQWHHPTKWIMFTNWPFQLNLSLNSWWWQEFEVWSNQWVAWWEIDRAWTYKLKCIISWAYSQTKTTNITVANVPDTSETYWLQWSVWTEWSNLNYWVANPFEHWTSWTSLWYVWTDKAWAIWIWTDNYLYWVDQNWYKKRAKWKVKQFASTWSNSASKSVSGKDPWCIFMDNEFWWTHISYIWYDWNKYLTWAWEYPYSY